MILSLEKSSVVSYISSSDDNMNNTSMIGIPELTMEELSSLINSSEFKKDAVVNGVLSAFYMWS